jgi:hypothetical protein
MRTQLLGKPLCVVLVVGAFCGAAAALGLGAHALSKGQAHRPAAQAAKAGATDARPTQPVSRDRAAPSEDASAAQDSWKRWPSLTDF